MKKNKYYIYSLSRHITTVECIAYNNQIKMHLVSELLINCINYNKTIKIDSIIYK